MTTSKEHEQYTRAISILVSQINPHASKEGRIGYIYSSGFLASYLASLMVEDPWAYKRFVKHIDGLKNQ